MGVVLDYMQTRIFKSNKNMLLDVLQTCSWNLLKSVQSVLGTVLRMQYQ